MNYNTIGDDPNSAARNGPSIRISVQHLKEEYRWMPVEGPSSPKPKSPAHGFRSNNPRNWRTFHDLALEKDQCPGINFGGKGLLLVLVIDLDLHEERADSPKQINETQLVIGRLHIWFAKQGCPIETSISGNGMHVFAAIGSGWEFGRKSHWTLKNGDGKPVAGVESFATGGNCYLLMTQDWKHGGVNDILPVIDFDDFRAELDAATGKITPPPQDVFHDTDWVSSALEVLNPNCSYDDWRDIGMALAGHPDGYRLWDAWSAKGDDYPGPNKTAEKWKSFKPDGGITRGTLWYMAEQAGWQPPQSGKSGIGGQRGGTASESNKQDNASNQGTAVREIMEQIVVGNDTIYWLADFYELRHGHWARQDAAYYRRLFSLTISKVQGNDRGVALVGNSAMLSYLSSLKNALTPPCVDTTLLAEEDRLGNFNLNTGELIRGVAFQNGVLEDGALKSMDARWFFATSRPYPFPERDPGRPVHFDTWLKGRLPDTETRQAAWEMLGATVTQELSSIQRMVALIGPGRSGKGTMLRIVAMLIGGGGATITFNGGPGRLARSQFASAPLQHAALVLLPDMPKPPSRNGIAQEHYILGLSILKSLTGGDPITIERKGKDLLFVRVPAGVWLDSNFDLAFVQGVEDALAWTERLVILPFGESVPESSWIPDYEERFRPELGAIAYHAVAAYAESRKRGNTTWSSEMIEAKARFLDGRTNGLEVFLNRSQGETRISIG